MTALGCRLSWETVSGFRLSNYDSAGKTRRDKKGVRRGLAYEARFVYSLHEDVVLTM